MNLSEERCWSFKGSFFTNIYENNIKIIFKKFVRLIYKKNLYLFFNVLGLKLNLKNFQ